MTEPETVDTEGTETAADEAVETDEATEAAEQTAADEAETAAGD